jgi:hypothetical protein
MNTSSSFFGPKGFPSFSGGSSQFDLGSPGSFVDRFKDSSQQSQAQKGSWQNAAKTFGGMLSNIGEGRKAGDVFNDVRPLGYAMPGYTQGLGEGLSIYNPPTMAPIVIGGASAPQKGTGQRIAGAAGGALQGAATGSAIMPGIGTAAGALIGGIGGLFG